MEKKGERKRKNGTGRKIGQGRKETKFPTPTVSAKPNRETEWGVKKRPKGSGEGPEVLVYKIV